MIRTIEPMPPSSTLLRSRREKSIAASLTDRKPARDLDSNRVAADATLGPDAAAAEPAAARPRRARPSGPRRPDTRTSGAARPRGPTASRPWRSPRPGPSALRLGTGVVGVFTRGPALLAQQAAALADASGGRFALGIGASSDRIVEGWNRMPFSKPLTRISETLDFLDAAFAGERTSTGFKLEQPPAEPRPIVLAALRGKMLRLAVERAAGAFTNFLPLSALPRVDRRAGAGAARGSSSCAGSSASPGSASRSSPWRDSCSPPTPRCRCTRPSSAGWATASGSTRWSPPGRPRIARPPSRRRPGT